MPNKKKTKKTTKKSPVKKAAVKLPAVKAVIGKETVSFTLAVKPFTLEVILGAAYLMTDRYYAALSGDRKKSLTVTLSGREKLSAKALKELAESFERELATQVVRWQIARDNLPVREYVQEMAVKLAQEPPAAAGAEAPAAEELSEDQRSEIDALIAEVENEIKELKDTPAGKDPKNISASWEEKHKAA